MKNILIVDDNAGDRKLIEIAIDDAELDVNIIHAESGEEAIRIAQQDKPDLILMDIMLTGMNGAETVKVLKSDQRTDRIPVIFLTNVYSKDDEKEENRLVVEDELYESFAKPFDTNAFISAVSKYVK